MQIPEGVHLQIVDPDGALIEEVQLDDYDTDSALDAHNVGETTLGAIARWMERRDV